MVRCQRSMFLTLLLALGLTSSSRAQQSTTPTVTYERFTPMVVDASQPTSVLLEVKVAGTPSSVRLMLPSTAKEVLLTDDGTAGDKVAGDGLYSIQLSPADVLFDFKEDDLNRNLVGYLRLYQGSTFNGQRNEFIDVLTPATVPPVVIRALAPNVQTTEHVVNIVDRGFYDTFAIQAVTKEFYRYFLDEYDFVNLIYEVSYPQNRYHFGIRNNVQGIGSRLIDNGALYGSSSRLQGCSVFPIPTYFDGAEAGYQHELGHQWINFLTAPPLSQGNPHWPLSDLAADIMGMSIPGSNVGGAFPYDLIPEGNGFRLVSTSGKPRVFSDLSLYMMGLIPPEQVQKHIVFDNQNQDSSTGRLLGPVTTVDITDIVRALGPRVPTSAQSQREFRLATILVSRDGLVSENVMRLYEFFSARAEGRSIVPYSQGLAKGLTTPFYLSTRGLATLNTRVYTPPPGTQRATLTAAPRSVLTGSSLTVAWNNVPGPSASDWVGLYSPEAPDTVYMARWTTDGTASGSLAALLPPGLVGGYYELRLFAGSASQRLATSSAFTVVRMEITPSAPTPSDPLTIRLSGIWRDACIPRNPRATVVGGQIRIATFGPGAAVCATVLTPWSLTVPIGQLTAGTYLLAVTYEQESLGANEITIKAP